MMSSRRVRVMIQEIFEAPTAPELETTPQRDHNKPPHPTKPIPDLYVNETYLRFRPDNEVFP